MSDDLELAKKEKEINKDKNKENALEEWVPFEKESQKDNAHNKTTGFTMEDFRSYLIKFIMIC